MSKLDARCQSSAWGRLRARNIQFLELSLVLGSILFIKLERATNRARELSWARTCVLVRDCAHLIEKPVKVIRVSPSKSSIT